jgi:ATP-dependent Clp protease ATP-binding subunit ClpB
MATRFDKFTIKAQEALQGTQEVAGRFGNQQLEPVHLLQALLEQSEGIVPAILERLGGTPSAVAQEVEKAIERLPKVGGASDHYLSPALKEVLDQAAKETAVQGRICFHRASAAGAGQKEGRRCRPDPQPSGRDA